jgi:glutathione S-transferase
MSLLEFYFAPGSSSMAPHIALYEVGAPFERRPMSFARREAHEAWFLALNPEGKVPVLLVDGRALTEVAGILWYLAKQYPEARLLEVEEAWAVSWMSFLASTVHSAFQRGVEAARSAWALAERRLGGAEWALGSYSVVDIHLFRLFWRFRGRVGGNVDAYPALSAHYNRMMAREAVKRTIGAEAAIGYELPP